MGVPLAPLEAGQLHIKELFGALLTGFVVNKAK